MLVRFIVDARLPAYAQIVRIGEVREIEGYAAEELIRDGVAVEVEPVDPEAPVVEPKRTTAARPEIEQATSRPGELR